MNLDSIIQNIKKIKADEDISDFQTDQLLSSLRSRDAFETEKIYLIDLKTLKNIEAISKYAEEIDETFMRLNTIFETGDLARNDIEELISQFHAGNLNSQHENLACELEKWETTILSLNKDCKNFPKIKDNWYLKFGLICYLAGDMYGALSCFNFAIKLNPKYYDCYFYKGTVLAGLSRKEESLECWNYLIQASEKFAFINIIKGRVFYNLDRKAESIDVYDQFIQNNPESCFANVLKVFSLSELEEFRKIKTCSKEMIRLNPRFSEAYYYKGLYFEGLEEYPNALKWFRKAIEYDEQAYYGYIGIASAFCNQNKYEESLDYINIVIAINPFYAMCHSDKGHTLYCMKRDEEALECLNEAIKLDPNFHIAYNEIGCILFRKEQYEEAIRYYDMALRITPGDKAYQDNKMNALQELEEREKNRALLK